MQSKGKKAMTANERAHVEQVALGDQDALRAELRTMTELAQN